MRRIFAWTLIWSLLFAGTSTIAIFIGRQQPISEQLEALHITDCRLPCWIGITPRQTTQGEVEMLFRKAYPYREPFFIVPHDGGGGVQMQTYSTNDHMPASSDIVPHIFIADIDKSGNYVLPDSPLMPRLGDMLLLLGQPTCMFPRAPDFWLLRYNLGQDGLSVVDIFVKGHRLWPEQPVYYLNLYRTPPEYSKECSKEGHQSWSGFANLQRK
jgi:hypothetical protein